MLKLWTIAGYMLLALLSVLAFVGILVYHAALRAWGNPQWHRVERRGR